MVPGLLFAIALAAGAQSSGAAAEPQRIASDYGPQVAPAQTPAAARPAEPSCAAQAVAHPDAVVVCAQRPQGYRLNSDVMEAKRDEHRQQTGALPPPNLLKGDSCRTVGPMGCRGMMGINVLAAAMTAAEMADRLSKGEEIGSMFVTDPQKSEYDYYLEAKTRREAAEAAAAEKAKTRATVEP